MGKKKLAVIDDSVQAEEPKKEQPRKKVLGINRASEEETASAKPERKKILGINKEKNVISSDSEKSADKQQVKSEDLSAAPRDDKKKAAPAEPQKPQHSKKYQEAREKVERNKLYSIPEAVTLAKEASYSKFPGSLEIHINTNLKSLRGLVQLPFASGKKLTILAFGKGAAESGADQVGDDEKIKNIEKGKIDFDVLVTTPEWMPKLARCAKVLGPRGLMPNPKSGTITDDLKKAVGELQGGKTEYKTEKSAGVIHLSLGKLSQPDEELQQNIRVLLATIGKSKLKKVTVAPTMGPGIKVDTSSI